MDDHPTKFARRAYRVSDRIQFEHDVVILVRDKHLRLRFGPHFIGRLPSLSHRVASHLRWQTSDVIKQPRSKLHPSLGTIELGKPDIVSSHPIGDSRFKILGAAPRQRASGQPRTTPRSPFPQTAVRALAGLAKVRQGRAGQSNWIWTTKGEVVVRICTSWPVFPLTSTLRRDRPGLSTPEPLSQPASGIVAVRLRER